MIAVTETERFLRRLGSGALLLVVLIGGGILIAPEGDAAAYDAAASGDEHAENPPPRRTNESGMIGDVRTVISAEAAIQSDARRIFDRP